MAIHGFPTEIFYGLCREVASLNTETNSATAISAASAGDTVVGCADTSKLQVDELVAYYSAANDHYYAGKVKSINTNVSIELAWALEGAVQAGANLKNWWVPSTHPSDFGYRSIADYWYDAVIAAFPGINTGTHGVFGDSYIANGNIVTRLAEKLTGASAVYNLGVGGNRVSEMIARYDTDIVPLDLDYCWCDGGVNEVLSLVPLATYQANVTTLVDMLAADGIQPFWFGVPPIMQQYTHSKLLADNTIYTGTYTPNVASASLDAAHTQLTATGYDFKTDSGSPTNVEISEDGTKWISCTSVVSTTDSEIVTTFRTVPKGSYQTRVTNHDGNSNSAGQGTFTVSPYGGVQSDLTIQ